LHIIKRSIELKKEIVEKDPNESGLRQILNFGHTFGHALEAFNNFNIKHGFAVAQGILLESKIAEILGDLDKKEREKILELMRLFDFPLTIDLDVDTDKIIDFMIADKKTRKQKPRFVIINKIGQIKSDKNNFSFEVEDAAIKKAIDLCKND